MKKPWHNEEIAVAEIEEFSVRRYSPGDDEKLIAFFNQTFKKYAGFVPRTPEYWSWYYKSRFDVDGEGIIILEYKDQIVAYSVVGKTGNIWEFCYDTNNQKASSIANLLLDKSVAYATSKGANEIKIHAPEDDKTIREVCSKMGFTSTHFHYLFLAILDFKKLIDEIIENSNSAKLGNNSAQIILKDAPKWAEKSLTFDLRKSTSGKVNPINPDVKIQMNTISLAEIMFRRKNLWWGLLKRDIKVMPFWKIFSAFNFLERIRLNDTWFTPLGDCY